jgi:hypothetical protein
LKPITVWEKFNVKEQRWDHNHIEDGHVPINQNKPTGTPEQTKTWESGTWMFFYKYLDGKQRVI